MGSATRRKKSRWKKIAIGIFVFVVIAGITGAKFMGKKKQEEFMTVPVKLGVVEVKLTETGNIELLRTVDVKSKIAGTIQKIYVKEGDDVVTGQILCVIDPDPTQTLLLFQKRAAVAQSKINLDQAEKELERKGELAKTSLISAKDLEDVENTFLIRQNAYLLAKQELEIMEREIETMGTGPEEKIVSSKVRAPYNGYITQRFIEEGSVVTSGISSVVAGTVIFQIGDPSTKIIKANISEVDIGKVRVGMDVRIKLDAYPDTSFAGKIRHISPVGTLQQGRNVVTFKTEVEIIDEDPCLKPGMSCDVDVLIARADSVMYLPVESVYEKKEGTEEDGNEKKTPVVYMKKKVENVPEKKMFGFIPKKTDPLDSFNECEVQTGLRAENRIQLTTAGIDTSTVVALDAEKIFSELEKRTNKKEKKDEPLTDK